MGIGGFIGNARLDPRAVFSDKERVAGNALDRIAFDRDTADAGGERGDLRRGMEGRGETLIVQDAQDRFMIRAHTAHGVGILLAVRNAGVGKRGLFGFGDHVPTALLFDADAVQAFCADRFPADLLTFDGVFDTFELRRGQAGEGKAVFIKSPMGSPF